MYFFFLDGKKPNSAKMVLINFLVHSRQIAILYQGQKFAEKTFISVNPIKKRLLGYFGVQNSFLHWKQSPTVKVDDMMVD